MEYRLGLGATSDSGAGATALRIVCDPLLLDQLLQLFHSSKAE